MMTVHNFRIKPEMRLELVTPDGESIDLHSPPTRAIWNMSGWGMSPREVSVIRGPFQQGDTVLSHRLSPREIALTIRHNGCSKNEYLGNRGTWVDYLRENRQSLYNPDPFQLIWHFIEDNTYKSRALDVYFEEGFIFTPPRSGVWDGFAIQEELKFIAHDPLVYDPTQNTKSITSFTQELILGSPFPLVLNTFYATDTITYTGTWETFPQIVVSGPAKNFSIFNLTTDKRINYTGYVQEGNDLIIDLKYGLKTVVTECGVSKLENISGDIGTFNIQCAPQAAGGVNNIKIITEDYDPNHTAFAIKYYTRYRGI